MLIPLPNITYNVQEAIDYYETVKANFQDLKISKKEANEIASFSDTQKTERVESFLKFVNYAEPFINWPQEQIIEFLEEKGLAFTKNAHFWFINVDSMGVESSKLDRQEELRFGFVKKLLEIFPDASTVELVVNPVGTKYHRHTDKDGLLRVIIPIIADAGAVWHFDNEQNVTHPPGHAYLLLKKHPHATDVLGPSERVSIHFQLAADKQEWVTTLNRAL